MKFVCECRMCDGTGRICLVCGDSPSGCACTADASKRECEACDGTGDDLSALDDKHCAKIMTTSDDDALAGRFPKHPRET